MNLGKLFETQAALDEHIMQEHPELRGQNNLDWKLLALQVELGECANEWRGFKKWSKDQEPRTRKYLTPYTEQDACLGVGAQWTNPLLEEYVDCLHFILSIGLEIGDTNFDVHSRNEYVKSDFGNRKMDITEQFISLNWLVGCILEYKIHYEQTLFELINLGEMLGFTWEQVEEAYYAKNKVNHERQNAGY